MTEREAIERIKKHIEIHHLKEPRAIEITVALLKAIEALEKDLWHYPSKGELPEKDGEYLIAVKLNDNSFINALAIYTAGKGWLGIFNAPFAWQCIKSPENKK